MNEEMIKNLSEEEKHRRQHPYWVWESILQIPEMLSLCLTKDIVFQILNVVKKFKEKEIDKILLLGRGSSFFSTIAEKYCLEYLTGIPVFCAVTNVFEAYPYIRIDSRTAVFFHSHSGKSEGDVDVVNMVKHSGGYTIGITDIPNSSLAVAVDDVMIGPGGSKVELPATRTYSTAMYRMMQFAIHLGKELGHFEEAKELDYFLTQIPKLLEDNLSDFEKQAQLAVKEIENCSSFILTAFGPNTSTSEEGAMALSQTTGVPAQSYEMENYIHGPMQALTKNQCVISIAPSGLLQDRIIRMTKAARIIGAKTVLLAPDGRINPSEVDVLIKMPKDLPDLLSPLVYMLPLWQIGYFYALLGRGGHPDRLSMDKPEFKEAFAFLMKTDKWVTQK